VLSVVFPFCQLFAEIKNDCGGKIMPVRLSAPLKSVDLRVFFGYCLPRNQRPPDIPNEAEAFYTVVRSIFFVSPQVFQL
jgi:hypothetical protein